MQQTWSSIARFFEGEWGSVILAAVVVLVVGVILARLLRLAIQRVLARNMSDAHAAVAARASTRRP